MVAEYRDWLTWLLAHAPDNAEQEIERRDKILATSKMLSTIEIKVKKVKSRAWYLHTTNI